MSIRSPNGYSNTGRQDIVVNVRCCIWYYQVRCIDKEQSERKLRERERLLFGKGIDYIDIQVLSYWMYHSIDLLINISENESGITMMITAFMRFCICGGTA